jgi:hypothetical protein
MSNRQLFIPIFLQTELERLANACGVQFNIGDDAGESEYLYFMDQLVTKAEITESHIESLQEKLNQRENPDKSKYSTTLSIKEQKLVKQTQAFGQEVNQDIKKADEGLGYAEKINRLHQKFQKEKDQRKVLETFIQAQNKKIKVLVDHVEKLMKAIKIESNKRIQIVEQSRQMANEQNLIQLRTEKQERINTLQHRTIQELREGSKVLEDQLRLMDEKYLELKSKYDLAREQFNRTYKKLSKDNDDMKVYIRMNGGMRDSMGASGTIPRSSSSPPTSPVNRNIQITIPPSNRQYSTSQGISPYAGDVAVGSGMNPVLSRKAATLSSTSGSFHQQQNDTLQKPQEIAIAMSSSFLLGLSSPKGRPASPTQDQSNMMQILQKTNALEVTTPEARDVMFRPMSAASPMAPSGSQYDLRGRPHTAVASEFSSSMRKKRNNKALNHVLDKITRHSGKKTVWSAERLSSLLED